MRNLTAYVDSSRWKYAIEVHFDFATVYLKNDETFYYILKRKWFELFSVDVVDVDELTTTTTRRDETRRGKKGDSRKLWMCARVASVDNAVPRKENGALSLAFIRLSDLLLLHDSTASIVRTCSQCTDIASGQRI